MSAVVAVSSVPLQFTGNFLSLAVVFIVLAIIAYVAGAREIAGLTAGIARIFIIIFIILAIISLIL